MIFAAGLGTRLKPITDTLPKALVPVGGKTLLEHVVTKLASQGFDDLVINVHHHADMIIDFLKEKKNFGLNIAISDERDLLLETGGGIRKAASLLDDEPFLVHNVDILSNADLKSLYNQHLDSKNTVTLLVNDRQTSRYLLFDEQQRMCGWLNKKTGEVKSPVFDFHPCDYQQYAFSGIHVVSPDVFKWMNDYPEKFPIMDFYIENAANFRIGAAVDNQLRLIDVGKLDTLKEAEERIKEFIA